MTTTERVALAHGGSRYSENEGLTMTELQQKLGGLEPTEIAFSNFKNGVYRLNGASVAIGALWTEDATDWGTFNPATSVVAGQGLVAGDDDDPTATAALFNAFWPNGFIAQVTWNYADTSSRILFDLYTGTTFAEEYRVTLQSDNVLADYKPTQDGVAARVADPGVGIVRALIRITPTKISAMQASGLSSVYRRPGATPNLTKFSIAMFNNAKLLDIAFYSPDVPFMDLLV